MQSIILHLQVAGESSLDGLHCTSTGNNVSCVMVDLINVVNENRSFIVSTLSFRNVLLRLKAPGNGSRAEI